MPGIYSVSGFKSEMAANAVAIDCKQLFVELLKTMKEWAIKTRDKIDTYNKELEPIRREVLMSVQE